MIAQRVDLNALQDERDRQSMFTLRRQVTVNRRFIAEVDGLRCAAILAVVIFHLSAYTVGRHMTGAVFRSLDLFASTLFAQGHIGVQLFFALSGFLLAMPFAKWRLRLGPRPSLRAYYLRRLTRLEPPYVVAMLL